MSKKDFKIIKDIEKKIEELQDDINFIHNFLQPSIDLVFNKEDDYEGPVVQIPAEIYDKILEYSENKDFVFMGVA